MRTSFHINLSHRILIYSEFVSSSLDVQFIPGPITDELWGLEMWYQLFPISSARFWVWNFWKGTVGVTYPPFFTFQYWNSVLAMVYLHLLFFFFLFFLFPWHLCILHALFLFQHLALGLFSSSGWHRWFHSHYFHMLVYPVVARTTRNFPVN